MVPSRHYLLILILCLSASLKSQGFPRGPELRWALLHPFAAMKVRHKLPEIRETCRLVKLHPNLDTFVSGGKLDAFRHSFAMAYLAQTVPVRKLRKLGIAHEKQNYRDFKHLKQEDSEVADSLACVMDLRNNETGFAIGAVHKHSDLATLQTLVIEAIRHGDAVYLKRDAAGQYLRCDGSPIQLRDFKHRWYIPKCLIKSNE